MEYANRRRRILLSRGGEWSGVYRLGGFECLRFERRFRQSPVELCNWRSGYRLSLGGQRSGVRLIGRRHVLCLRIEIEPVNPCSGALIPNERMMSVIGIFRNCPRRASSVRRKLLTSNFIGRPTQTKDQCEKAP